MVYIFLDTGFPVEVEMEHRFYRIKLLVGERGWSGGISATQGGVGFRKSMVEAIIRREGD
jgi:hypothetical protein